MFPPQVVPERGPTTSRALSFDPPIRTQSLKTDLNTVGTNMVESFVYNRLGAFVNTLAMMGDNLAYNP
jgi:hypothetical protein